MNWFRSRIRSSARLALFALAVQMVLSFGHMHRDDLGLPPLAASDGAQVVAATTPTSAHPADQNQYPAPDDYCPICASMVLIATAVPSLPPVLIVPGPVEPAWLSPAPVHSVTPQFVLSFRARAPPLA
ncbi:MAG TPA: DUF2946 family protein [Xanthobacteraceae bacterium]|jgi:hypothetical protein